MAVIGFVLTDQDNIRFGEFRKMFDRGRKGAVGEGKFRMPNLTGASKPRIDEDGEAM